MYVSRITRDHYSTRSYDPIAQPTVAHGQNDRNRKRAQTFIRSIESRPPFPRLCAFIAAIHDTRGVSDFDFHGMELRPAGNDRLNGPTNPNGLFNPDLVSIEFFPKQILLLERKVENDWKRNTPIFIPFELSFIGKYPRARSDPFLASFLFNIDNNFQALSPPLNRAKRDIVSREEERVMVSLLVSPLSLDGSRYR